MVLPGTAASLYFGVILGRTDAPARGSDNEETGLLPCVATVCCRHLHGEVRHRKKSKAENFRLWRVADLLAQRVRVRSSGEEWTCEKLRATTAFDPERTWHRTELRSRGRRTSMYQPLCLG